MGNGTDMKVVNSAVSRILQINLPLLAPSTHSIPLSNAPESVSDVVVSCTPTFQDAMSHHHNSCGTETFRATSHQYLKRKGKVNLLMVAHFEKVSAIRLQSVRNTS
jgi:hypothetical protein